MSQSGLRLTWVLALSTLLGCGGSGQTPEHFKTVKVNGTLTYKGQPAPSFQVLFTPVEQGARPARGRTDASGNFVLGTNQPGDGAPVGKHKISVAFEPDPEVDSTQAIPIEDPSKMPRSDVEIPTKYTNPETSGLTVDVPAGGLKDYKLELQ